MLRIFRGEVSPFASLGKRSSPLGLVLDADRIGNTVDVVEVGDHLDCVVDRGVAQALGAQPLDVGGTDRGRPKRELDGEVAKGALLRTEIGLAVVVSRVLCELFRGALGTEVVAMRANSVVAVVRA
jgi:hypothetical protein